MTQLFTIGDPRTLYCKARMSAHRGVWNPVTKLWMFGNVDDCANALCELYQRRAPRLRCAKRSTR